MAAAGALPMLITAFGVAALTPLLAGILNRRAFPFAIFARLFNAVQVWRGGAGLPAIPVGSLTSTLVVSLGLVEGDKFRVQSITEISRALDNKGGNRGLWFGRCRLAKQIQRRSRPLPIPK